VILAVPDLVHTCLRPSGRENESGLCPLFFMGNRR